MLAAGHLHHLERKMRVVGKKDDKEKAGVRRMSHYEGNPPSQSKMMYRQYT